MVSSYGVVDDAFVAALCAATATTSVFRLGDPSAADEIEVASGDESRHPPHAPDVVVKPADCDEVIRVVKLCKKHKIPVVTRGLGTGLEGGCVPYSGGVVLDVKRLRNTEILAADFQVVVGPGILKDELNAFLQPHGFLLGPDPASNPSVGGMAATGGSGMSTLRYGTTRENLVSLKVVTAEGELVTTRRRVRKSSTGYDLTQLFCGSEGTLGVIVELVFRIHPIARTRVGALAVFDDVRVAADAVVQVLNASLSHLVRCEMLNADGIVATNAHFKTQLEAKPTLFFELQANDTETAKLEACAVERIIVANGARWQFAADGAAIDDIWAARRGCYRAAVGWQKKRNKVHVTDVCVPLSNLPSCISETERDFKNAGFPCIMCCHIADGNFHCLVPYTESTHDKLAEVEHSMVERALAMDGTVSGEHGVGIGKLKHMVHEHGENGIDLMQRIKRALDPDNIMNPGKVIPMDDFAAKL